MATTFPQYLKNRKRSNPISGDAPSRIYFCERHWTFYSSLLLKVDSFLYLEHHYWLESFHDICFRVPLFSASITLELFQAVDIPSWFQVDLGT